ncbi:MAG: hypothetical protein ACK5L0_04830 [Candidatus Fimivivens sp.]
MAATVTAAQLRTTVYNKLAARCPDATEDVLNECIDRAQEHFCGVTGRANIPPCALYLWIDMSARVYGLLQSPDMATGAAVTSIKRGDTTISYAEGAVAEAMADIDSRVLRYRVVRAR